MPATFGVLVAGGAGTRLGLGVPKALVRVAGIRLLDRALTILAPVCDELVVAAPAELGIRVPEHWGTGGDARPILCVEDASGARGPLAGMVAGLRSRAFDRALVLGVDLPFVEPATLRALLGRLAGRHAVVPLPSGIPQPLAAAYSADAGALLATRLAAGERSPTRALDALDVDRVDDAALVGLPGGPGAFLNLNTREDLNEAERRLAARAESR